MIRTLIVTSLVVVAAKPVLAQSDEAQSLIEDGVKSLIERLNEAGYQGIEGGALHLFDPSEEVGVEPYLFGRDGAPMSVTTEAEITALPASCEIKASEKPWRFCLASTPIEPAPPFGKRSCAYAIPSPRIWVQDQDDYYYQGDYVYSVWCEVFY